MSQVTIVSQSGGGGGGVDSVGAGTNIVITGTSTNPIVNLSDNPNVAGTVTAQDFKLPATTANNVMGTLFINNSRFLYAYPDATSTYVGMNAGNAENTGTNNTAIGAQALASVDTASNCTTLGYQAGFDMEDSQDCVIIGSLASAGATANGCIVIGKGAGLSNLDPATKNIYIGNVGVNAETLITRIGDDQTNCYLAGIVNSNFGFNFPTTTANFGAGFIQQNGIPIYHNYGNNVTVDNVFIGPNAGNASAADNTGNGITCIGTSAMTNITAGVGQMVVVGNYACQNLNNSFQAVAIGNSVAQSCPNITGSVIIGTSASPSASAVTGSVVIGQQALLNAAGSLDGNILIGNEVASNFESTESNNIIIGNGGQTGDFGVIRIGDDELQFAGTYIAGIQNNVDSSGTLLNVVGIQTTDQLTSITLVAGANISLTPASGSITIAASALVSWSEVTSNTTMQPNSGYLVNSSSLVTLTLPTTAAQFTEIKIMGKGTGGWKVAQNTGQTIYFGTFTSTSGSSGTLSSTSQRDTVTLRCITANTEWQVEDGPQGNLTVA